MIGNVLVKEFDVYLDFGVYIIHLSLRAPCEVKLDRWMSNLVTREDNSVDLESLRSLVNPFEAGTDGTLVCFALQCPSKCPFRHHFL